MVPSAPGSSQCTPGRQYPLIIALTGTDTCGNFFYWYTGLRPIAYEKGFIIMFPDNVAGKWCAPIIAGDPKWASHCGDPAQPETVQDDAAYIVSLGEEAKRDYWIGDVFAFGWSNG